MQALFFLINAVVTFFTMVFLLRFYMQWRRASFNNPVGAFVLQLTNWAVIPLRRVIPGFFGLDFASLLPVLCAQGFIQALRITSSGALEVVGQSKVIMAILWQTLVGSVAAFVNLLIGILIIQALLSWLNPYSPFAGIARQLTEPMLEPIRRFIPLVANIDLSPLVAIILLQAFLLFL